MSRPPESDHDNLAVAILAVAAFLFTSSLLCWAAAHLTLLLTDSPAPTNSIQHVHRATPPGPAPSNSGAANAVGFVLELVRSHDPSAAWARTYPGEPRLESGIFWVILALLFTGLVAVSAAAYTAGILPGAGGTARSDPARWATRRQEQKIAAGRDPARRRWRLVAGRGQVSHRLLAGEDCVSAVVFGPNGSGKTTSLIVPNVIDWDGPVVMTTAKPQDLHPVCLARANHGPVWVIAPGGAPGHPCVGWSPISTASDPESADRVAQWMVESSGMQDDPKARPWNAQARKYLKGLLLAAHHHGGGIEQWTRWIHAGEKARDLVEDILHSAGHHTVAQEYASTWQIHEEGKGSVLFTALGLADTYTRPGIISAVETGGFTVTDLLDHGGTLCIVTPNAEGDRYAPYFTTLVSAIIHEAESRAARQGGPLTPRLLLALDEAGNVFRYPRLPNLLTTARGNGIQLMLIYHDLAQVEHLYGGREVARTVLSNAKMRMLLPGVGDLETLRYWSDLMGQTRTETRGSSTSADGRRTRSTSEHNDHLAPLHCLQQLPDGQAILIYQNLPPTRVRLLPWYADRRYRLLHEPPTRR